MIVYIQSYDENSAMKMIFTPPAIILISIGYMEMKHSNKIHISEALII